jgi:hypothetical protein
MNQPLYFFGLKGLQVIAAFFGLLFCYFLFGMVGLGVGVVALYFPCKKNYVEWRKGSPDFFTSYRVWSRTKRSLEDRQKLLSTL